MSKESVWESLTSLYSTLITNRSAQDVATLRSLITKRYKDMTSTQKTSIKSNLKGAYNYTDLNRVARFCNLLNEYVGYLGYRIDGYSDIKSDWVRNNSPSKVQLDEYISAVTILRDYWASLMPVPDDISRGLTVKQANAIEEALKACYDAIDNMQQHQVYCGTFACGQLTQFGLGESL